MEENQQPTKQVIARNERGQYLPGVSGNPNGRVSFSLISILKEKLQEIPQGQKEEAARKLVKVYLRKAFKGDDALLKDIFDRIDGKPKESIQHSGELTENIELDEKTKQLLDEFLLCRKKTI